MHNRLSQGIIKKGGWSIDTGEAAKVDELHFSLFADWGHVYLKWERGGRTHGSWHKFTGTPDWSAVGEWLTTVERTLVQDEHEVSADGLADIVSSQLGCPA